MSYKIDTRKLRKVLNMLLDDIESIPQHETNGSWKRGIGAGIGKVGKFHISIDVDEFDCDDIAILSDVITDEPPTTLEKGIV